MSRWRIVGSKRSSGQWPLATARAACFIPWRRSVPWAMHCEYARISDGPSYASASRNAITACSLLAPIATWAT